MDTSSLSKGTIAAMLGALALCALAIHLLLLLDWKPTDFDAQ
jgi:hypothetical protein